MNFTIEEKNGITSVRFPKNPTFEDLKESVDAIIERGEPGLRLWDLSNGGSMSTEEIRSIAEYGKHKLTKPAKAALIAPKPLLYGLTRMFEAYRKNPITDLFVFESEAEAMEWLKE